MPNYFYHLNVHKAPNKQWSVGEKINHSGYNNYYKNIVECCVYAANGEDSVPIDYILTLPATYRKSQLLAINGRAKALKHLHREQVFERVRASEYPCLPSRQSCTFLLPRKEDLECWIDSLNETNSPYSLLVVEPLPNANIFVTYAGNLDNLEPTYNDDQMMSKARGYWTGNEDGRKEILVEGGVVVVGVESTLCPRNTF
ncbi:DUF2441 domain-containing protein [Pectobacterium peruviense]|uniref:DUF2441 domain-containing protein n=1 Tax=Pectobacterium peruviense TaxID=2066479 RepID=UPI000DE1FA61|nr:DUF2441 domain-containing protein [Pectobacterium peruviense]